MSDKKFIGYKGLFIHRNKKWRWQIRLNKKIKTFTIGNIEDFKEEDVKKIVDAIDLKKEKTEELIKYKLQEQIILLKNNKKNNDYISENLKKADQKNNQKEKNTIQSEIIKPHKIFNITTNLSEELIYCKDILPVKKGICAILSGKGGVGKSFLIIQEALQFLYENNTAKAFLWLTEDSEIEIKNRVIMTLFFILKIKDPKEVASILNRFFFYGSSVSPILFFNENNKTISKKFLKMMSFFNEYDFIALDPFSSFFNGDENSNTEVNLFIKEIAKYASINNKIFFILHHHSKNGQLRGAVAFRDGVRLHYSVIKKVNNKVLVEIEKDNVNIQKYFNNKNKKSIVIFKEINNEELNKYHTFIKDLELMFNFDINKLEESKIIKTIKFIQQNEHSVIDLDVENKNKTCKEKKKKELRKFFVTNPFNKQIEKQILNIME